MATISNTPRPGYVWDSTDNVWYPIGVGGHSHPDYITQATAVNPTLIDAKGDIITATAADTPARLAVGNNGETLVADSSTSSGLRYTALFGANKNKIINGDFNINQRAFTSTTTDNIYMFDRWKNRSIDGTSTWSAQTFTPGAAPVSGYEATNYLQVITTGQTLSTARTVLRQHIEDVRVLAGQTVTVSFWAKAATGTPSVAFAFVQSPNGSADATSIFGKVAISTSWARYSLTASVASLSGITIGSNSSSYLDLYFSAGTALSTSSSSLGIQSNTFSVWGMQVEAGPVATPFQTATGTLQGELAACQRYYYRVTTPTSNYGAMGLWGIQSTTTTGVMIGKNPVTMRVEPTSIEYSSLAVSDSSGTESITALTINSDRTNADMISCDSTNSGALTQYRYSYIRANNSSSAYFGVSAEL